MRNGLRIQVNMQFFDMGCVGVIKRQATRNYINNAFKSLVAYDI